MASTALSLVKAFVSTRFPVAPPKQGGLDDRHQAPAAFVRFLGGVTHGLAALGLADFRAY